MSISFTPERWARVREDSRRWWAGELDRPLILATAPGHEPGREPSRQPFHFYTAFYDTGVPPDEIVDAWDYHLSTCEFLGDAFPQVWLNFGPGVVAAFLGARLEPRPAEETVWFHRTTSKSIRELDLRLDPDNPWLCKCRELARAAGDRWQGMVQVGMTDLGGILDILSTFRPGTDLIYDLADDPESAKHCLKDLEAAWWQAFELIDAELRPASPGWSSWPGFFSPDPHYTLQCDFSFMISPDWFEKFVLPTLAADCRRLPNAVYHMDGPGQLAHLDHLLSIPELKVIQWIPGAGQPEMSEWPEVYQKIRGAGKLIQTFGPPRILRNLAAQLGSAKGILHIGTVGEDGDRDEWNQLISEFGANPSETQARSCPPVEALAETGERDHSRRHQRACGPAMPDMTTTPKPDGIHTMVPRDRMTASARILRDTYARVPGTPLLQREFWLMEPTIERWIAEEGMPANVPHEQLFDLDQPGHHELMELGWTEAAFHPAFGEEQIEDRGETEVVRDFAGRHVLYFKGRRHGFMPDYLGHPVQDRKSWEEDVRWRLDPAAAGRFDTLDRRMAEAAAAAGRGLMICQRLIGGYMFLRSLIGPEDLLYLFYDDPGLVHACMEAWLELADAVIARHQQHLTLDELFLSEDICYNNGPLISPDMIREFLFPYYQQLVANTRARQIDSSRHLYLQVDTDGFANPVIPLYGELGMDAMSPFEIASGSDVIAIGREFPWLALFGGIDKRILARSTAEIDRELGRILPAMRARGGFIPTIDHGVPIEVPYRNYLHYRQRCRELSR